MLIFPSKFMMLRRIGSFDFSNDSMVSSFIRMESNACYSMLFCISHVVYHKLFSNILVQL